MFKNRENAGGEDIGEVRGEGESESIGLDMARSLPFRDGCESWLDWLGDQEVKPVPRVRRFPRARQAAGDL